MKGPARKIPKFQPEVELGNRQLQFDVPCLGRKTTMCGPQTLPLRSVWFVGWQRCLASCEFGQFGQQIRQSILNVRQTWGAVSKFQPKPGCADVHDPWHRGGLSFDPSKCHRSPDLPDRTGSSGTRKRWRCKRRMSHLADSTSTFCRSMQELRRPATGQGSSCKWCK